MTFDEFKNMWEDDPTIKLYETKTNTGEALYVVELYNDDFIKQDSLMFTAIELSLLIDPVGYIQSLVNYRADKLLR